MGFDTIEINLVNTFLYVQVEVGRVEKNGLKHANK